MFYEGLNKTFSGTTKTRENENLIFCPRPGSGREGITLHQPISDQCSIFTPRKNFRKPEVF